MTGHENAIIIDGKKYIFVSGLCTNGIECCDGCALKEVCERDHEDDHRICEIMGTMEDNTGNFQPAKDFEEVNSRLLDEDTYKALSRLGILNTSVRAYNRGSSDYSQHIIQPWSIWQDWNLNPWDADIVKRILRTKQGDSRILDYEKIIHICEERIRQLKEEHP